MFHSNLHNTQRVLIPRIMSLLGALAIAVGVLLLPSSTATAFQKGGGGGGSTPPADPAIAYLVLAKKPNISVMNADGARKSIVIQFQAAIITGIKWSPDGTKICFGFSGRLEDGVLRQGLALLDISIVNGTPVGSNFRMLTSGWPPQGPTWSLDSSYVAFADGSGIYGAPIDGSPAFTIATGAYEGPTSFSPDGSRIAFRYNDGVRDLIGVYENSSQTSFTVCPVGSSDLRAIDWARTGDRLLFDPAPHGPEVQIVDAVPGATPQTVATKSWFPSWSPDDSKIVYTTGTADSIVIRNLATGAVTSTGAKGRQSDWRRL